MKKYSIIFLITLTITTPMDNLFRENVSENISFCEILLSENCAFKNGISKRKNIILVAWIKKVLNGIAIIM